MRDQSIKPQSSELKCSFCGKAKSEVKKLIAGPTNVFICDECISFCDGLIREGNVPPDSDAARETSYIQGQRWAWHMMLVKCLNELGYDSPEWDKYRWIHERETTIHMLRSECARLGDNDWPDDLHIGDIIEKHLLRHIEET